MKTYCKLIIIAINCCTIIRNLSCVAQHKGKIMKNNNDTEKKIPFCFDGLNINGTGGNKFQCSRCKSNLGDRVFYQTTGEGYIRCFECGYHRDLYFKRDDAGNLIRKNDTKDFTYNNLILEEAISENPFGILNIKYIDKSWSPRILEKKTDYEKAVLKVSSELKQKHEIKKAEISRFVDGKFIKIILFPKAT